MRKSLPMLFLHVCFVHSTLGPGQAVVLLLWLSGPICHTPLSQLLSSLSSRRTSCSHPLLLQTLASVL